MANTYRSRKDGFCVAPMSNADLQAIAWNVRELFFPNGSKCLNVMNILEHQLPKYYEQFRYEIVEDSDLPGREAEFDPYSWCMRIRESVYSAAHNCNGHCRFTIAHEIGHFFLHRKQTLAFGRPANNEFVPDYRNSEWQADTFARHLLVPPRLAKGMSADEIAVVFEVSASVARIVCGKTGEFTTYKRLSFTSSNNELLPGFDWNTIK